MAGQRQPGSKSRGGQARNGRSSPGQTRGGQPASAGKSAASRSTAERAATAQSAAAKTTAAQTTASKSAAGRAARRDAARPAAAATSFPPGVEDSAVGRAWNGSSLSARIPGGRTSSELPPAPTWLRWTTWVLSLLGLGVSIYLTIEHYTTATVAGCPENATFNCTKVTTSPESIVFGIFPVAVLGLAFFAFMAVANSPGAWRLNLPALGWLRVGSLVVGIGFVLYLVSVEVLQVHAICLYCTSVHIITFILFVLVVFDATFRRPPTVPAARYAG